MVYHHPKSMDNILNDYEIGERIHEGQHSLVYCARHKRHGTRVIVKTNTSEHPTLDELTRLRREHEFLVSLPFSGVVESRGLARYKNRLALVMRDQGARDLRTVGANQPFSLEEGLDIAVQLAATLGEIHQRHVVHKDVNPNNIIMHPQTKHVQLIDFSIATRLSQENAYSAQPGLLEGTLRYISPEQTGRMNRAVDYRTDFYSLGVTLYELFTGVVPFVSEDPVELLHCHIARNPVPPHEVRSDLPRLLSEIIMKLLAKTAEERYQSGIGLVSDLKEVIARVKGDVGQSNETRRHDGFVLGRHDTSGKFKIAQKLYGREAQIAALLDSFERVSGGKAELLLVAGEPGIGKSALVNEVQKPLLGKRGYFITGKFDQLKRAIPYASLIEAFQDLVRQLLGEREDQLLGWKNKLMAALGNNASVVAEVMPTIELILGQQPPPLSLDPHEAQIRFNLVFENLVRAFAAEEHPLVIFLDDLQWADAPSLHLLNVLLTADVRHLCIVGSYRDNEVDETHPLMSTLNTIRKAGGQITTISLGALGQAEIENLIADTTHCELSQASPLAALLWQKTRGNPFFVNQLFSSLHEDGLIQFDVTSRQWRWNLDAIRQRDLTNNVVELMVGRLQKLPANSQRAMTTAACIGNHFEFKMLAMALNQNAGEVSRAIWPAIEEGLLQTIGDTHRTAEPARFVDDDNQVPVGSFKFLHDRVQQAAYALIEESQKSRIHVELGRLMLANTPDTEIEDRIFDIMNQFELGINQVVDEDERYIVAGFALRAGLKAKASAAFEPSLRYLSTGIELLPPNAFEHRHELAFDLTLETADLCQLNADERRAEELTRRAMDHARTTLETVRVLELRLRLHLQKNEYAEVLRIGLDAVERMGICIPRDPTPDDFQASFARVQALLAGKAPQDLLELPEMKDPEKLAALRIFLYLGNPSYSYKPALFPIIACEAFALTVKYGNSLQAPVSYIYFALVMSGAFNDPIAAVQYGDIACRVMESYNARQCSPIVFQLLGVTVFPWARPLHGMLDVLSQGIQAGIDTGNLEFAGLSAMNYSVLLLFLGEPLGSVVERQALHRKRLVRFKQDFQIRFSSVAYQAAMNLLGNSADPFVLTGEVMNEPEALAWMTKANNLPSLGMLYTTKAMVTYIFGDIQQAAAAARTSQQYAAALVGYMGSGWQNFYSSLCALGACANDSEAERNKVLEDVEKNQNQMKNWAEHAPTNFLHKWQLVEAERMRVLGKPLEAMTLYEQAIRGAAENRFPNEEAIANERCADLCRTLGWEQAADSYLRSAHHAYLRWGAVGKVADLERRYPGLSSLEKSTLDVHRSTHPSTASSSSNLDFATLMKAARAVSGEIMLPRLIETLMQTMLEIAGAQRGYLLLQHDNVLRIEAEWSEVSKACIARDSAPVTSTERLSTAIVNYASRTGKSVVLSDASVEGTFTRDAYVVEYKPKSVLCAPLVNQGLLIAMVYLENNLTTDAFTSERLEALHLLAAQAALSIHNARLYATLEQKVEARTQELSERNAELAAALTKLKATQQQLVTQEKLASLGALTSGIAHELKNPLNFIYNFTALSAETLQEINEVLEDQEPRIDKNAWSTLQDSLQSLAEMNETIDEHGKRANRIIEGMLLHARAGTGEREDVDLNALMSQCVSLARQSGRKGSVAYAGKIEESYDSTVGEIWIVVQDMCRVFLNILSNAIYAVQQKEKSLGAVFKSAITVRTQNLGDRVEIRIRDNGMGIGPEIADRIYNPFFTTKPPGEGTGLGLSLVHDIVVQGHQGEIRMETQPGEFAEFIVTIPATRADQSG